MLWPVPSLLSYLLDLREVRAQERLADFHLALAAARGSQEGVERVSAELEGAAGLTEPAGDIEDLAAALAGLE